MIEIAVLAAFFAAILVYRERAHDRQKEETEVRHGLEVQMLLNKIQHPEVYAPPQQAFFAHEVPVPVPGAEEPDEEEEQEFAKVGMIEGVGGDEDNG